MMGKDKESVRIVLTMIVALMGSVGILSLLPVQVDVFYYCLAGAFSVLFILLFNFENKLRWYIVIAMVFAAVICIVLFGSHIAGGMQLLYNDAVPVLNQNSSQKLSMLAVDAKTAGSEQVCRFAAFTVICLLAAVLAAVETVYIRSAVAAAVIVTPLFAVMLYFLAIPSVFSVVVCFMFIFSSAVLRKKGEDCIGGYIFICFAVISAGIVLIFYPKGMYKQAGLFSSIYHSMKWSDDTLSKAGGTVLGDGEHLGTVDEIIFQYKQVGLFSAVSTGENQYIKLSTKDRYMDNTWKRQSGYSGNGDEYTEKMYEIMDSSEKMRRSLAATDADYYSHFMKYSSFFLSGGSVQVRVYEKYFADVDNYKEFESNMRILSQQSRQYFDSYKDEVYEDYLEVPDSVREVIHQLLGRNYARNYDEKQEYIDYVREYLRDHYTYSLAPGRVPEGEEFVEYFLTEGKRGYCTYFATAAAMMLRCAGIPTRYCEGYLVNDDVLTSSNVYEDDTLVRKDIFERDVEIPVTYYTVPIMDSQAHAWVEVFMDGYGWVPVEFTPGVGTSQQAATSDADGVGMLEDEEDEEEEEEGASGDVAAFIPLNENENSQTNVNIIVIILGILFLVMMVLSFVSILRYIKSRKLIRSCGISNTDAVNHMYKYMMRLLKSMKYVRLPETDYEKFAEYLEGADEKLKEIGMCRAFDILLDIRFSNGQTRSGDFDELRGILQNMRKYCLKQRNIFKKFVFVWVWGL